MPIVAECPHCSRRLEAKDEWAGRQVRCPGCGTALALPAPARPSGAAAQPFATPVQRAPFAQTRPAARDGIMDLLEEAASAPAAPPLRPAASIVAPAKRRGKTSGLNKTRFVAFGALAGVGLAVLCCGIGVALIGPALDAGLKFGIRAKAREIAAKGAQIPVVLAPPPGSVLAEPGPPSGPAWAPDPRFAAQLKANFAFDRYLLQAPADFVIPTPPSTQELLGTKAQNWFWASQPLPNGGRNLITAEVLEFTVAPQRFVNDLEAELTQRLSWNRKPGAFSEFEHTPGERGQIAGIQFIRSNFSGLRKGDRIYGVLLIAMDGNRMLELQGHWHVAPGTPEYQVLEAVLLSFRKR